MKKKERRKIVVAPKKEPFFNWREAIMALIVGVVFYGGVIYLEVSAQERQMNIEERGQSHWQQKMEALKTIDNEIFVK